MRGLATAFIVRPRFAEILTAPRSAGGHLDTPELTSLTTVVRTRLRAPRVAADVLDRPRLEVRLVRALDASRVVVLSAPAGSGKTTLLARTLAGSPGAGHALAWLTVDQDDDDLLRFLYALTASLQQMAPECGMLAHHLITGTGPQERRDPVVFARRVLNLLINDILDLPAERIVLVIDDLHMVGDPAVFAALDYLIEHMPAQLTLVIATRHDPPLALARLRARRELTELRLADLRFTACETDALLNTTLNLGLAEAQLTALVRRTEGWAAGLTLLAASLERIATPEERAGFLDGLERTDRYLFDYLAEEVLSLQDPFVRMFLLETAILPDLSPDLCAAVTGRDDAAAILDDLYRRNLFLVRLGEEAGTPEDGLQALPTPVSAAHPPTYRYHDLFRDFLRERLAREAPGWARQLHLRAARAVGRGDRQIAHLIAAEEWAEAAAVIEECAQEVVSSNAILRLDSWLAALPAPVRESRPWLIYLHWGARLSWQRGDIEALRAAHRQTVALVRAYPFLDVLATRDLLQSLILIHERRYDEAVKLLEVIAEAQERSSFSVIFDNARVLLAWVHLHRGRRDEALAQLRCALERVARDAMPGLVMWEGREIVGPLMQLAIEHAIYPEVAGQVLELLGLPVTPATPALVTVPVTATGEALTPREVEVLRLIASGASNQDIAEQLVISLHTAKRHVANILAKLEVASRAGAAVRAFDLGICKAAN